MPVVQARVARTVARLGGANRDVREVVSDLVQDTFAVLFDRDGHVLRSWDPARGLSLRNFVGLVAERHARSVLTTRRRSPWTDDPRPDPDEWAPSAPSAGDAVESRDLLRTALQRVEAELSPKGLVMFDALLLDDRSAEEVATAHEVSVDSVYQWRRRLLERVRSWMTALGRITPIGQGRR